MSALIELVMDIAVELVSGWTTAKWPLLGEAVGLVCLVIGVVVGLSSSGGDRVQALGICVFAGIALGSLLFCRRRKRRAAAPATE